MKDRTLSNLKVLHICTFDTGGAAIAALRLHKGLLLQGVQSKFLCLRKTVDELELYEYTKRKKLNFIEKIFNKIGFPLLKEVRNQKLLLGYPKEYEIFTFPETDINLLDSKLVQEADIIHLHWVGYFLDYQSFFKGIKKPIIWTLHDKNPILGGFHLLLDKAKNPCLLDLEMKLQKQKIKWINKNKNLTIVAPSKLLFDYSKSSKTFKSYPHFNILNGVDTHNFNFNDQLYARKQLGLPIEKKLVLFFNGTGFHKGNDMVFECIKKSNFEHLHFISLGGEKIDSPLISFIDIIEDQHSLSYLYVASDLFLLPSREDNLPNMMLESLVCGTPVLGTPIGGILDVIEDGINGMIAKETNWASIQSILLEFDKGIYNFDREAIMKSAIKKFNLTLYSQNYLNLYLKA